MSTARVRPPWAAWLYTHNPFYAISVVLMLFGVRAAFGTLEIGSINSWIMLGVLAAYTLALAGIAVAIVRWGSVWDDARSLFLLLLLLFLAVSISADELFVRSASPAAGIGLLICGFLGSAVLSEAVLRGARIRLRWGFRGPYYLMLALFYAWPWLCSPELHPRSAPALEWTIFLFPTVAAGLFLLLLPAVRRGEAYTARNGTPWPWPWFPWTMFGVIAAAVALRSFVLSMTFGPTGPIWIGSGRSLQNINYDTIFGTYFLVPLAFALLWLMLEGAVVAGNRALQWRLLALAPGLLLLALPFGGNDVFRSFLDRFVERCGSPLWISTGLVALFYARAWLASVPLAGRAFAATLLLFAVVGPETISPRTFTSPQPWPLLAIGGLTIAYGIRRQSSGWCVAGAALATLGLWLVLPRTIAADFRFTLSYHLFWGAVIVTGLAFRDRLAGMLRITGAVLMPFTALVVMASGRVDMVPLPWRIAYVAALAALALAIFGLFRQRWYLYAFAGIMALGGYGTAMIGYWQGVSVVGRAAMTSILWSVGSLLIALLISARKANWLPPGLAPRWGSGGNPPVPADSPPSS